MVLATTEIDSTWKIRTMTYPEYRQRFNELSQQGKLDVVVALVVVLVFKETINVEFVCSSSFFVQVRLPLFSVLVWFE
jgi:hypothetical protein